MEELFCENCGITETEPMFMQKYCRYCGAKIKPAPTFEDMVNQFNTEYAPMQEYGFRLRFEEDYIAGTKLTRAKVVLKNDKGIEDNGCLRMTDETYSLLKKYFLFKGIEIESNGGTVWEVKNDKSRSD